MDRTHHGPRRRPARTLAPAGILCALWGAWACASNDGQGDGGKPGADGTQTSPTSAATGTTGGDGSSGVGGATGTSTSGAPTTTTSGESSVGGSSNVTSVGGTGPTTTAGSGAGGGSGIGGSTMGTTQGVGGTSTGSGGSTSNGGSGGTPAVCPKGDGEICHEFFVNDNARHEVMYVNEFDPSLNYAQGTQDTSGGDSPRQLQIVENSEASDGRAILVSVNSGYEEYDFVNHALLASASFGDISVRGAQRLPDGNTAIGYGDATLRIVNPAGDTVSECSLPGSGGDTLRVLSHDPDSGFIYYGRGLDVFAVNTSCQEQWSATFPDGSSKAYRVLARPGGGAWAATGYPASVIEFDGQSQVVSEVGGLDEFPGVMDFSSGFDVTASGNIVIANWWGHVVPPPEQGPHVVEFNPANEIVWQWGTQAEATQVTNVLLVR